MSLPRFQQIQFEFTANIRNPDDTRLPDSVEERRMAIYRELVFNNIEDLLANFFPVLKSILPIARWHRLIREFLIHHRSQTPIFMELAAEFVNFLQQKNAHCDTDPAYLAELAHYEWLEIELHTSTQEVNLAGTDTTGNLLDGIPCPSPLVHLSRYTFPVHKISPLNTGPEAQDTFLLVYRDQSDEVQYMETNLIAARLLELINHNILSVTKYTGRQLLESIASELLHPDPDMVISGGRQIMQDWLKRDILLGTQKN